MNKLIKIGIFLLGIVNGFFASSQIQTPVQINTLLNPPYSPFYSDFYKVSSKALMATLLFKDFSEPSWDIRLKVKISSSNGVTIESSPSAGYSPITIYPGVPLTIEGDDWVPYLAFENVAISGTDPKILTEKGVLPEGFYTICVEAVDFKSGKLLSNSGCASGFFQLGGIPQIISPRTNYILPSNPQNIIFQWIMTAPPLNPANTEYQLRVFEITTEGVDPAVAIKSDNALKIYESEFTNNLQFVFDASATQLEIGKRYVYQVKVADKNNQAVFRNDGLSEPNWFMYGYPTGGKIELELPEANFQFQPGKQQLFKWLSPDNKAAPSQPVAYRLRIVKIEAADTNNIVDAYKNKPVVYDETTRPTTSSTSWETIVTEEFERDVWFLWKIEGYSGEQKVAESVINKFKGRPTLEKFLAGDHEVAVLSTKNNDLNKLSGTGRVKLDREGKKFAEVDFKDIKIKKIANEVYVLEQGELFKEITNGEAEEIKPKDGKRASLFFTPNAVKLDKNALRLRGKMVVPLDIVIDGEQPKITSQNTWVDYNKFKITGGVKISGKYDLMEPLNFTILLDTNTTAFIGINGYDLVYYGSIGLPESSQSAEGKRITLPFVNLRDLTYIELDAEKDDIRIPPYRPIPNTNLLVQPKNFVIDFSDKKSPADFPSDWKGAYIPRFDLQFKQKFDEKKRITFDEEVVEAIDLSKTKTIKNYFKATGLFFNYSKEIDPTTKIKFNAFTAKPGLFEVLVENGVVKSGIFKASIDIPIIDEAKKFRVSANINNDGFIDGILEEKLEGKKITFSEKSPESRGDFTIKRIKFSEANCLDATVDVEVKGLKMAVNNQSGFKIFGTHQIGFDRPNGECIFEKEMVGYANGIVEVNIAGIGAAFLNGKYLYYMKGAMNLSDDFSGPGGEPLSNNFYGSIELNTSLNIPNDYENKPKVPISSAVLNTKPENIKSVDKLEVELNTPVAFMSGTLEIKKDDPQWGNVFTGTLSGFIYAPTKIKAGSTMIVGKDPSGTKFWYFEAFAKDDGIGYPIVPGVINAVGIEGNIYGNMSSEVDKKTKAITMKVDKKVRFGGALYMQLIDAASNGVNVKADVGLEMKYLEGDFQLAMQAEGTLVNLTGRSVVPGEAASAALQPLAEKAAGEVVNQVNNQSIKVGDWTFNPNIKPDLSEGGLKGKNGNTSISFGANVIKKFGYFYFEDQDWKLDISGSSSTKALAFNMAKKSGNAYGMGLAYFPGDSASLNFNVGTSFGLKGSYLEKNRRGSFGMNYDGKSMFVSSDLIKQSATLSFVPSSDFNLYTSIDKSLGSAAIKIKADGHSIGLEGKKSGYGKLQIDDNLAVEFDKENSQGKVKVNTNGVDVDIEGSAEKSSMKLNASGILLDAGLETNNGKGWMTYQKENDKYSFDLDTKNQSGKILIATSAKEFSLGADKKEGSAFFTLDAASYKLNAKANLNEASGLFDFKKDNDQYILAVNPDSAVVNMNNADLNLKLAGYKEKRGLLSFKSGNLGVKVGADAEGRGNLFFQNDNLKIVAAGDKTIGMGSFSLALPNNDSLNLYLNDKEGKGRFAGLYGNRFVGGSIDRSGRGSISLAMPEFAMALAGDSKGFGKIFLNIPKENVMLNIEGDKKSKIGIASFVLANDSVSGKFDLNEGNGSINSAVDGNSISGAFDKAGKANISLKTGERSLDANLDSKGNSSLNFTQPNLKVDMAGIKSDAKGTLYFKLDNDSISAKLDKNKGVAQFKASYADFSLGANVENKDGKGDMYYQEKERKIVVKGDKTGNGFATYIDNANSFSILADKNKGNIDLGLKLSADSVRMQVIEKSRFVGLVKAGQISTNFNINKTGDKVFAYKDADNKLAISQFKDKTLYFESSIKAVNLYGQTFADGKKFVRYEYKGDSLSAALGADKSKLVKYYIDNVFIEASKLANNDVFVRVKDGDKDFKASRNATEQFVDFVNGQKRIRVDKETLLVNDGEHEVILKNDKPKPRLFIDGKEVTLEIGKLYEFKGFSFSYTIDGDLSFLKIKFPNLPDFNAGFSLGKFPYLSVKFPTYDLSFKGVDFGFDFNLGGFKLEFPTLDGLSFKMPSGLDLKFSGYDIDLNFGDFKTNFRGKFDFSLAFGDIFAFDFALDELKWRFNKYTFGIDKLFNIKFQLPEAPRWATYNLNTEMFKMSFDAFKFDFEPYKLIQFAYDTKIFNLFDTGIEFKFNKMALAFELDKYLRFNFDVDKYFNITPINISTKWDKLDLGLSMDSLRFAYLPIKLNIDPKMFAVDLNGKMLSFDINKNLKFNYSIDKFFQVSPLAFDGKWGKYGMSFPKVGNFSLTDGIRSFSIGDVGLNLKDVDLDLNYNFDKDLSLKYKLDLFSISMDKISLRMDKYDLGFGKLDGLWYMDGKYNFKFKDVLSFDIDGYAMSYNFKSPNIQFNVPKYKLNVGGWTDKLNFTYDDFNLSLGKIDGLIYFDKFSRFEFNTDLLIKTGLADLELGIKGLKLPTKSFYFKIKEYNLSYSGLTGIKFSMPNKWFSIGGKLYFGIGWDDLNIECGLGSLRAFKTDYGITYGGDKYFGVLYKKSEVSFMKDRSLKMIDGDKGVTIDEDGIITLKNGTQEIVAGGDQPIKFKDANGMEMKDGSGSDGFKFNVAGMDFDVKATDDNNVLIETKQKMATIAIASEGEGTMSATLSNGSTKYGTLYKNKYTWGLALGNETADKGPQASQNIKMSGPSKIGKITTNSTSILQAIAYASFSTKTGELYINGQVTATKPLMCIENGTFSCKFSKDDFYIKVAEPDKMASLRPLCIALDTKGYFHVSPRRYAAGISKSYRFALEGGFSEEALGVTVISISAGVKFGYLIEGEGILVITKSGDENYVELEKLRIKVEGDASAYISGKVFGVGGKVSMGVYMGGELILILTRNEKSFEGKMYAGFEFLGEDFDIDFKAKLEI